MFSYYNNGRFSFPPNFDFNIIPGKDSPTNVISVIGEGDLFSVINKMGMFENMTSSSMKPMNIIPPFRNDFNNDLCNSYLNGYYCEKLKLVFIHLRSLHDSDLILNKITTMDNNKLKENEFDTEDAVYLKLVLYLFLLSDFIIVNVIGINLDPYYIRLFSEVNALRKKFKTVTENELKTVSNSMEITNNGRLIQPRLLFVFNLHNSPLISELRQNNKAIATMRDNMEERLYAVLKYHNICGTEYSLAKVQTCFNFVFIRLPRQSIADSFTDLLKEFINSGISDDYSEDDEDREDRAFEKFINNQVQAFNVTKDSNGYGSESISCRNWFKACHKLYNLFSTDKLRFTDSLSNHRFAFFKKGCELALSVAESHYKDGLPAQYSRNVHYDKTKSARQIMLTVAKGPGLLQCVKRLEHNLNKVWAVGRQICEVTSVTGQRCKHEVHVVPDSDSADWNLNNMQRTSYENTCTEDGLFSNEGSLSGGNNKQTGDAKKNLPSMKHCSEVQLVSACNCGRRQATRRDPFDYREANYTFYEEMTETCCFRFTRVALPENSGTISPEKSLEVKEVMETACKLEEDELSDQSERGFECSSPGDLSLSQSNQMLPRRARRMDPSTSSADDRFQDEHESVSTDSESSPSEHSVNRSIASLSRDTVRGPINKITFLGMFTNTTDPKCGPRYPSWSLIDSGPYFSYTHASGLEYNGFVHGSNFLLPWDVPLKTRINKVRKQRVKRAFAAGNFVKAFLGYEMECPVGHRFFLAGPKNMMQGSMASQQVKEAVHGLLTKDIPLYFPCQCSKYLAQLMRIYVAVPNSNLLRVFVQPRVRPGPPDETPVFTPGNNGPIELEAGHLWVLRLPFAYEHEGHIYRQQDDLRVIEECKVLKECIYYEEISDPDD